MKILLLAAQAVPLSPAGEPGALAGGLARALAELGHDVRVALPAAARSAEGHFRAAPVARFVVPHTGGDQAARASMLAQAGVTFYMIGGPPPTRAHAGGGDGAEAGRQAVFFSLAALGLCRALEWAPDVVHACDPAAGPALYWLAADGRHEPLFARTATIFTFHELGGARSGAWPALRQYGLAPSDSPLLPDWARVTLLGLGLAHADVLAAGSPSQAREVLTPEFGHGWEGLFRARRDRLVGILGGLDLDEWDPRRDPHLEARYDAGGLARRALNKRALQDALGFPAQPRTPLIAIVSRLEAEQGFDIALPALCRLVAETPAQVVVVGPVAPDMSSDLEQLRRDLPGQVRVRLRANEALVRRVYAGADVWLKPAREEPYGQAAMIALRYGAVPVVRRAGAQSDVVIDAAVPGRGSGFVFTDYNSGALLAAARRALRAYGRAARWSVLQRRGLRQAQHFAWARVARSYLALYVQATTLRRETATPLRPAPSGELARQATRRARASDPFQRPRR